MKTYEFSAYENYITLQINHLQGMPHYNEITDAITKHLENGCIYFIIDIAELQYIDSVGLSTLITILTKARNAGGEVVLLQPAPKVEKILIVTKLHNLFYVATNVAEAVTHFKTESVL